MDSFDISRIQREKGFRVVHVNARSVLNKMDDIRSNLGIFDVVIITETWLDASAHDSFINWPNYKHVRIDRSQFRNKRGGGICIYVKSQHNFEVIPLQIQNIDKDGEFLHVRIKPVKQKPVDLIAVYTRQMVQQENLQKPYRS